MEMNVGSELARTLEEKKERPVIRHIEDIPIAPSGICKIVREAVDAIRTQVNQCFYAWWFG